MQPCFRPCSAWRCLLRLLRLWPLPLLALLGGCSMLGYYTHLAVGEAQVLRQRRPLATMIADPATPAPLRQRLRLAVAARHFASNRLGLPRNQSYLSYADIGRPYVMYNVFATKTLSLQPIKRCFPIAGCVAYQGFYSLRRARTAAAKLRRSGKDVYIGGVPAYSTLGHFADPILSSMNHWSRAELIGTIFHELAHQQVYVPGATTFNESFATFVQRQGLRQWRQARHLPAPDLTRARRRHQFTHLVLTTRRQLQALYAGTAPVAAKLRRKQVIINDLRRRYRQLVDGPWQGQDPYAEWMAKPINNAKLLPFGLYDQHTAAFARLFRQTGGDWKMFYRRVQTIGAGPAAARKAFLDATATPQR